MPDPTDSPVVVITGASSGIGRATAHAFARSGARLVLVARRQAPLEAAAKECAGLGARAAIAVPADVTDADALERAADRAVAAFGRIDVWVNNAGVAALGRFEDMPLDAFRRVMDVNLYGYVHGARAALRQFRAQASRGVLINNASFLGAVGAPYASAYVASKFAVRGLSECLRQELQDTPGIQVCTVLPATMDTPLFQRSANYTGRPLRAVDPVYDPAVTARTIARLARHPQREVTAGGFARLAVTAKALAPGLTERAVGRVGPLLQFQRMRARVAPRSDGNLFTPIDDGRQVTGGWPRSARPVAAGAVGTLAVLAACAMLVIRSVDWGGTGRRPQR